MSKRKKYSDDEITAFLAFVDRQRETGATIEESCEEFSKERDRQFSPSLYQWHKASRREKITRPKERPEHREAPRQSGTRTMPSIFYSTLGADQIIAIIGAPEQVLKVIQELQEKQT